MKIVFTFLLYLLGIQASLSASPPIMDPNICSSEEKKDSSCELHCISKGIESKVLSLDYIFSYLLFMDDNSSKIKKFYFCFKIEPKSNAPPKYLV
ncbi:MAG: hypothetical protein CMM89_01255 [Rickettsiales bacterium]|nr:hypothetical protein [Rickettsiales bacterium]OUT46156.1 MAG: hypothetical protein CBB73_01220 [Pelagibacteraceae bacterium TMED13]|tara:strand:- start:555 stop:839 length:285 start_codon:yes stop_codon:yes gene_type:complete